jgi:Ca2+-binding RTX toxin-like protein
MVHLASRTARTNTLVGTQGDDYFLITAPTAVDGLGGYDTLAVDFSASAGALHLDLSGLWTGGVGWLNGHQIRNIEAIGSPYADSGTENAIVIGSEQDDIVILGAAYSQRAVVYGLGGDDVLRGGDSDPAITGANNFLNGGSGDDRVFGGAYGDDLLGEDGDDLLDGGGGDDLLFGDAGRDLLRGDAGADYLRGGAGDDQLQGGAGDDRLDGSLGADVLNGGGGSDTAEYYGAEAGVVVSLALGLAWEDGRLDLLSSIENAAGSFFGDVLIGSAGANLLIGDLGDDELYGRGGADRLWGGQGADRLEGGAGADLFLFGAGDFDGAGGSDLIADFDGAGGDRIDLSAAGAFTFIGDAAFSGTAGELRVAASGHAWEVSGDRDGDGVGDFSILVVSPAPLVAGDFVL